MIKIDLFKPDIYHQVALVRKIAQIGIRDISETALPITETKTRKRLTIQGTPQNLGKLTSETIFGHSKVVFWPLLRTKRTFSQNPAMSRF